MAFDKSEWVPLTGLGHMVQAGEIKSIDEILNSGKPIKEPEIVDAFLPDLVDEVLDINMVQRMTDSGRRVKFRAVVVVGNRDGYVGWTRKRFSGWRCNQEGHRERQDQSDKSPPWLWFMGMWM